MRYGYDLHNPIEREMYFKKHERDLQRMLNKGEDINKNFRDIIKETQEEMEYFKQREKQEQEIEKRIQEETERRIEKQIEKELPSIIERALDKELQKIFK